MQVNTERSNGSLAGWETRRAGRPRKKQAQLTIKLPDRHFLEAVKAEARIRRMSVNAFMRAMIRGYFGAA